MGPIKKTKVYLLPLLSIAFILILLLKPALSIGAAKTGLLLWFNTVLPSLLPFIIGTNILMESGSIYFFEKVFSPIMEPLFKVPGCCAFPWIMGLISGYPMGARLAGELHRTDKITDLQLQRLLSFCNNGGPFFILGAVGIGMLGNEHLGYFLLLVHFLSSMLVGLLFRFYGQETNHKPRAHKTSFKPAHSVGEVLGSSVTSAMEVILQIGGYIIIFSVFSALLKETALVNLIAKGLSFIFKTLGITTELSLSWIVGIIELSNGTSMVATALSPLALKLAVISFILGWGGLSIHAQSLSFLKKTALKTPLYLLSKFLHGIIAFTITLLLFPMYINYSEQSVPAFAASNINLLPIISISFIIFTFILSVFTIKAQQK